MSVILETTIGDLVVDLFTEERPRACLNFLKLCKVKYYNYNLFHSVQRNFLAQSGDPTGSGRGGEAVFRSLYGNQAKFFEAETKPRIKHVKKGTVSMVNNGNDMHGSQFFITLGENLDYLDGQHTVFGEVAEGFEILDKLNEAICDDSHRPYQDIRITHTVVLDDPYDDPEGLKVPDRSPEPTKEQLDSGRIGADEEIDDTKGKTQEQVEEMIEERELNAGTQILEMVGDIPDADVKPPENVLFVCKLNPVTTDEDLEIIFSRFGAIKCCEIIKDSVSQESLQYAFIEYENVEDCERAYFKMDNVLIDDRRVHVDFSQSVAKLVHNKPGSKPVYELKDNKETKEKLKIKDRSRKEKYDLVFDESDSDGGKRSTPSKRSKEKKDYKKRRRTSTSDERSPENRKHKDVDVKSGGNHHGNLKRDSHEEERLHMSARERQGNEKDTRGDKRDKRHTKRDKDDRAEKRRRDRDSDEGEIRGKLGHSGKRGDRGSEDRYRRNDRDITGDKGKRENSEDKYSKDSRGYSRNEEGYKEKAKKKTKEGSLDRSRKQRQDSEEPCSEDKRGYQRKTKTARDNEASDDSRSYSRNEKGHKEETKKTTKEVSLEGKRKQRQDSEEPYSGDKRGYYRKTKTTRDSEASDDSRGYSRNEKGHKEETKKTTKEGSLDRSRKQRQDSEEPCSGDKRGFYRKTKTTMDSEASDDASISEDEDRRSKRRKDDKKHDEKKKKKYRQQSESDS